MHCVYVWARSWLLIRISLNSCHYAVSYCRKGVWFFSSVHWLTMTQPHRALLTVQDCQIVSSFVSGLNTHLNSHNYGNCVLQYTSMELFTIPIRYKELAYFVSRTIVLRYWHIFPDSCLTTLWFTDFSRVLVILFTGWDESCLKQTRSILIGQSVRCLQVHVYGGDDLLYTTTTYTQNRQTMNDTNGATRSVHHSVNRPHTDARRDTQTDRWAQ